MSALPEALGARLGDGVVAMKRVSGGSINDAWRVGLESGRTAFVKARAGAARADFDAEAAGLRWLSAAGAVRIPAVLGVGDEPPWLALEWIEPGLLSESGAEQLGRALAALHRSGAPAHGALPPGSPDRTLRIGSVELPVRERASWAELYAGNMLSPLVARARDRGSLTAGDARAIELACRRIAELAGPPEAPARLHGDLWGGNVHSDAQGAGWLIDPAAHGGHREIDLAMLRLFGGAAVGRERVFSAYGEAHPLAPGHEERIALWQLLPLLVHAVLFGGAYGARAGEAARRYS